MEWGYTFPKDICPKEEVVARMETELRYYDVVVQLVNFYAIRTLPKRRPQ